MHLPYSPYINYSNTFIVTHIQPFIFQYIEWKMFLPRWLVKQRGQDKIVAISIFDFLHDSCCSLITFHWYMSSIYNKPKFAQIMIWHQTGDITLSEPTTAYFTGVYLRYLISVGKLTDWTPLNSKNENCTVWKLFLWNRDGMLGFLENAKFV